MQLTPQTNPALGEGSGTGLAFSGSRSALPFHGDLRERRDKIDVHVLRSETSSLTPCQVICKMSTPQELLLQKRNWGRFPCIFCPAGLEPSAAELFIYCHDERGTRKGLSLFLTNPSSRREQSRNAREGKNSSVRLCVGVPGGSGVPALPPDRQLAVPALGTRSGAVGNAPICHWNGSAAAEASPGHREGQAPTPSSSSQC